MGWIGPIGGRKDHLAIDLDAIPLRQAPPYTETDIIQGDAFGRKFRAAADIERLRRIGGCAGEDVSGGDFLAVDVNPVGCAIEGRGDVVPGVGRQDVAGLERAGAEAGLQARAIEHIDKWVRAIRLAVGAAAQDWL